MFEHGAVAPTVEAGENLLGLTFHLVGERLDEPRAPEGVRYVRDPGLVGDDLLGAQRDAGRLLGGQRQDLVHRIGMQALGPSEHAGQCLDGGADDVDLGLLGRE